MDSLSDDILTHGDVSRALRNLFQRGIQDDRGQRGQGLRELLERLRKQRQRELERYNLDSVYEDAKERPAGHCADGEGRRRQKDWGSQGDGSQKHRHRP